MKIMMPIFSRPLEFSEVKIPVIIIEDSRTYYKIAEDIHDQIEGMDGDVIISDLGSPLDLGKNAEMVIDILSLDYNQRKSISQLQKRLSEISMQNQLYSDYKELQHFISMFIQKLADQIPFPLTFSQELQLTELLKAAEIKFDFDSQSISEYLINYFSILREFGGKTVFFVCNLKNWIDEKELLNFYKDVIYRKLNVILLENHFSKNIPEYEIYRIIDSDLCEIN